MRLLPVGMSAFFRSTRPTVIWQTHEAGDALTRPSPLSARQGHVHKDISPWNMAKSVIGFDFKSHASTCKYFLICIFGPTHFWLDGCCRISNIAIEFSEKRLSFPLTHTTRLKMLWLKDILALGVCVLISAKRLRPRMSNLRTSLGSFTAAWIGLEREELACSCPAACSCFPSPLEGHDRV